MVCLLDSIFLLKHPPMFHKKNKNIKIREDKKKSTGQQSLKDLKNANNNFDKIILILGRIYIKFRRKSVIDTSLTLSNSKK